MAGIRSDDQEEGPSPLHSTPLHKHGHFTLGIRGGTPRHSAKLALVVATGGRVGVSLSCEGEGLPWDLWPVRPTRVSPKSRQGSRVQVATIRAQQAHVLAKEPPTKGSPSHPIHYPRSYQLDKCPAGSLFPPAAAPPPGPSVYQGAVMYRPPRLPPDRASFLDAPALSLTPPRNCPLLLRAPAPP